MEFKRFWKIYAGLAIIFGITFYLSLDSGPIKNTKLKDSAGYSDFELAEAAKLSKNKLELSDIADAGAQKALGFDREEPKEEPRNEKTVPDVAYKPEKELVEEDSEGDCGSFKNLDCVPKESKIRVTARSKNESIDAPVIKTSSKKQDEKKEPDASRRGSGRKQWQSDVARKDALIAMGSGRTQTIEAESPTVSTDKYIKKGSKYYGFIDERVVVYKGGEPQFLNIYITGQASPNATRKPFALYAKASWSKNGIIVEVKDCLSIDPRQLSISCEAQVSDVIKGGTGLDAKIYNPSVWGKLIQIAANLIAGSHLDQITQTIAPSGQILSSGSSDRVQRALADAWTQAGKEAASMYTGDRAEAPAGAIVKILIKSDVRLW